LPFDFCPTAIFIYVTSMNTKEQARKLAADYSKKSFKANMV